MDEKTQSAKTLTLIVYALHGAAFFVGITAIIGLIMNYVKREDVAGTIYESHFTWQIRTFWWGLLWSVVGWLTIIFVIGFAVLAAAYIWWIYRVIKGFLRMNDGKALYATA